MHNGSIEKSFLKSVCKDKIFASSTQKTCTKSIFDKENDHPNFKFESPSK
jgi:hypothetical protein